MAEKEFAGKTVQISDEGYLVDPSEWTKEIALEIAKEEEIELTDKHFEVIEFIRQRQAAGEVLSIRKVGKSGIIDVKQFYTLFPGGPLKKSSRIAGIPKPSSCV